MIPQVAIGVCVQVAATFIVDIDQFAYQAICPACAASAMESPWSSTRVPSARALAIFTSGAIAGITTVTGMPRPLAPAYVCYVFVEMKEESW